MDAEPSDFIIWRRKPIHLKGNTGHIVIILEKPVKEKDDCIRVVVLDSSRSRHARDTRKKGGNRSRLETWNWKVEIGENSTKAWGPISNFYFLISTFHERLRKEISVGVMWFRIDETGAPIAVHWSNRNRNPKTYSIVTGRASVMSSLQCRTSLRHCEAEGRGNLSDYAKLAHSSRRLLRFSRNDTRDLTRH